MTLIRLPGNGYVVNSLLGGSDSQRTSQGPNLQCFIDRVASYPERLEYMYFNAVVLLRAVARIGPYLSAYDYCGTGTHESDAETLEKLNGVLSMAQHVGKFDETVLFRGENAEVHNFVTHCRRLS